jgi:hypothetical protein
MIKLVRHLQVQYLVLWAELCHSATWQGRTGTARQMAEPPRQNVAELETVGAVKDVLHSVRLVYDSMN